MIALSVLLAAQIIGHLSAPDSYADILNEYHSGNQTAALERLGRLDLATIDTGFDALVKTSPAALAQSAAAMHTEAAFRPHGPTTANISRHHLQLATQLVEKEQAVKGTLARPLPKSPLRPVTEDFRRLWYLTVITALEGTLGLERAEKYADQARELYRNDAEVLLLSGIAAEMHASPRVEGVSDGERRKALERAAQHFRAAVARDPDRLEAQLRLGRVLYLQHDRSAREVLLRVTGAADPRLRYLAALFLGAACDAQQDSVSAETWYAKAVAAMPGAQAAVLAISESRYRAGDAEGAASVLPGAVRNSDAADPWWTYIFGEHWRMPILLGALRRAGHR